MAGSFAAHPDAACVAQWYECVAQYIKKTCLEDGPKMGDVLKQFAPEMVREQCQLRHNRRRTKHSDAFSGPVRPAKAFSFFAIHQLHQTI
jgi:hypothetical protein